MRYHPIHNLLISLINISKLLTLLNNVSPLNILLTQQKWNHVLEKYYKDKGEDIIQ